MSGYYFPQEVGFDGKYFLQWGAGTKRVRIYFLYASLVTGIRKIIWIHF